MKKRNHLVPAEVNVVVAEWKRPKDDRPTQNELALRFNVASVTIRRALAEAGLLKLAGYKTADEEVILQFLISQGLDNIDALRKFVVKARTGQNGK